MYTNSAIRHFDFSNTTNKNIDAKMKPTQTHPTCTINLRTTQTNLQHRLLSFAARGKATPRGTCDVYLPKFSLSYKMKEAKSLLRELGVRSIFSSNADFSRMTHSEEPLKVSGVFHRATIDVNENGVEASAATAVTILTRNAASVRMIDRPFLFAVRHDATGAILFAGKVTRPRADQ